MKFFIVIITLLICTTQSFAYSTNASKFAEKQYEKLNCTKVHINSTKEYSLKYKEFIGKNFVNSITFGYGDLKTKGKKQNKYRITYSVFLDCKNKPLWSSVYFSK